MRVVLRAVVLVLILGWSSAVSAAPVSLIFDYFGDLSAATFGGSGIPNNSVAVSGYVNPQMFGDTSVIGLTAHQRYANPPVTNDMSGTFFAEGGGDTLNGQPGYGRWNFGWYWKVDSPSQYYMELLYDSDPGVGTDTNQMGKILFPLMTGQNTLQDSWNLGMGFLYQAVPGLTPPSYGAFNPNVGGEYSFQMTIRNAAGQRMGRTTSINVVVAEPGSVPEPTTLLMFGVGLVLLSGRMRRWSRH